MCRASRRPATCRSTSRSFSCRGAARLPSPIAPTKWRNRCLSIASRRTTSSSMNGAQSYEQDQDYTLDLSNGQSNIVPRATMAGKTVHVQVTEHFPGYQCSINNMDWSPAVMFDAATPFPDVRKNYFPIDIVDGWFPVVDELGSPLGIQIQPVLGNITYEALLRIEVV